VLSALFNLRVVQQTFYGPANEKFARLADVTFSLDSPMVLAGLFCSSGCFRRCCSA
jgi:hypothetical protein